MQYTYILISIFGLCFFLLKKRKFDLFSLAYFSSFMYFFPAFVGYVSHSIGYARIEEKILDETYLVFCIVLISILISALIFDSIQIKKLNISLNSKAEYFTSEVSLFLAITTTFFSVITVGDKMFSTYKLDIINYINLWIIFSMYFVTISTVLSFFKKNKTIFFISILILAFYLFVGFRFPLAISAISIFIIYFSNQKIRLFNYKKYIFYFMLFGVFFLIFKRFYIAIKMFDLDLIISLYENKEFLITSFTHAEPFEIQNILNKVIQTNFTLPVNHLFEQFISIFIFEIESLGIDIPSFNSYFQNRLFPNVMFGMSANIWAQIYSVGGLFGILLFSVFYNSFIASINYIYLASHKSLYIKSILVILGVYWSFYLHRNDLAYIFSSQKKIVICAVFIYIIAKFYKYFKSYSK